MEELGIDAEVEEVLRVKASEVTDNEHVVLYRVRSDQEPNPDPVEIVEGRFISPESLTRDMNERPSDLVPAFIHLWKEYWRTID
jgi:isopentenyldiphosphate isomerase